MGALGFVQLIVDVVFLFLLMVLFVGRVWKRGSAVTEEHASYREMISSLTVLIREMKETTTDLEDRAGRKHLELQRAVGAADDRLEALLRVANAPAAPADSARAAAVPVRPEPSLPSPAPRRGGVQPIADDEDERREKYRVALDFARKGWSALEIARHTQLPRGEVELLIKTRGGQLGGEG